MVQVQCFLVDFCLDYLSVVESGVLKSLTIIVLLSISPFRSVSICLIYLGTLMLYAYIFMIYLLDELILLSLQNDLLYILFNFLA